MDFPAVFTDPPTTSSVQALVTTLHLGLAAVRNHRRLASSPVSPLAAFSLTLGLLPWLLPAPLGLAVGLLAHGAWFTMCELLGPRPLARPPASVAPPARVAPVKASPASGARLPAPPPAAPRPPTPASAFQPVPVLAVIDETPSIKTIRFARPDGFEFEPGQFVTVRVRIDGKEYARCYSISSAPEALGYLEISVRRQGVVSSALHASARPGSALAIKGPLGVFKYPSGDDRPIVLFAGGIGITPLISMLRHAVATAPTRPVTLLYSARTEEDFAFYDELQTIARRHPQTRVLFAASSGAHGPSLHSGHIDEMLVRTTVKNLTDSISFICGPTPMIEGMRSLLAGLGVPAAQIRHEVFNAAVAAASSREPESEVVAPPAREAAARPRATTAVATYQMACQESRRSVALGAGQTILEAAEEANINVLSMCRAGVCGTCRIRVAEGDVVCASDALPADDLAQGFVLACVTTAQSDCTAHI